MIKATIALFLSTSLIVACAMGSKPKPRNINKKDFRACKTSDTSNPLGKLCNRSCKKRVGKKCKEWKITVLDLSLQKDFDFVKNGDFVCRDSDRVY